MTPAGSAGPLAGVHVLDMSALGPGPFCGMMFADHGADVVAVQRPLAGPDPDPSAQFSRGKRSVIVDLRTPDGPGVIARLIDRTDVLLESNRPGTLERRGLGPDELLARNPRLVYTRLTGWGQTGPFASRAGHDINYIATGGALGVIGRDEPVPPLNIVGDFASGSLMAFIGTTLALLERERTGRGQVVDAAMVDGAALLLTAQLAEYNAGQWNGPRNAMLGGAAPFYGVYQCADGKWFAVGAIEQKFYAGFLAVLGIDDVQLEDQYDRQRWPDLRDRVAKVFSSQTRDHWVDVFSRIDACGDPVLEIEELADNPHLNDRGTIVERDGQLMAAPAPRLSGTQALIRARPSGPAAHTREVLLEGGFSAAEVDALASNGTITLSE
jgi:alpha-methylacyl-CoA racemase